MKTIKEAKDFLQDNWVDGTNCPCCNQFVKRYSRKLTSSMSAGLISLHNQTKDTNEPVHIKKIAQVNGGEFAQLKRWGLIRNSVNTDPTKRISGYWHITERGRQFVKGLISVPKYCDTYNGKTLKFSEELTNIRTSLGDKFSYAELMGKE